MGTWRRWMWRIETQSGQCKKISQKRAPGYYFLELFQLSLLARQIHSSKQLLHGLEYQSLFWSLYNIWKEASFSLLFWTKYVTSHGIRGSWSSRKKSLRAPVRTWTSSTESRTARLPWSIWRRSLWTTLRFPDWRYTPSVERYSGLIVVIYSFFSNARHILQGMRDIYLLSIMEIQRWTNRGTSEWSCL